MSSTSLRAAAAAVLISALTIGAAASSSPADAAVAPASCVGRALAKGASGADVATAQVWLRASGFRPGPVDGIFGSKTRLAVRRAEKARHWQRDGVLSMAELGQMGVACAVSAPVPAPAPAPTTPPAPAEDPSHTSLPIEVYIPKLGLRRNVRIAPDTDAVQRMINQCNGAIDIPWLTGGVYLAAHRTTCGNNGLGGIETLKPGDIVTITYANGAVRNYAVSGTTIERIGTMPDNLAGGAPVALQTSKSSTQAYVVACWPVG